MIITGAVLGASAVGALNAARSLLGISRIVIFGLSNIAGARAARVYHLMGVGELRRYILRLTTGLSASVIGLGVVASAAPEFWLRLAFGAEYSGFGFLVQWYAVIWVLIALIVPLEAGLTAIERTKAIFFPSSLLATAFGVTMAYTLVTHYGLVGVAAGIVVMIVIRNVSLAVSLFRQMSRLDGASSKVTEAS